MYNNAPVVIKISQEIDDSEVEPSQHGTPRERCRSDPCLPSRLPGDAFIQREADGLAPKAVKAELERIRKSLETPTSQHGDSKLSPTASVHNSPESSPKARRRSLLDMLPSAFNAAKTLREAAKKSEGPWRQPEPYEIMRAIERRDIMFLMEVRDRSFESLVKKSGDATPLIHAMRIEHTDMAIVLLGAFSRYINHLQDEDLQKPETKNMLKMLRTNLKIAIDFGLQKSQKDLMASFLQTLIMSEGDTWITLQAGDVAACLRMGTEGKPVHNAEAAVRSFATKNLGKADLIASLEDYVANATADLVMIAAWSSALQVINGEAIPTYYFARDDRVYRALVERLDRHKDELPKLGRRLRWQLRALRTHLEGRSRAYRAKVESLAKELDEGEGR
ncbi:hypothetical protein BD309DRAFT_967457 [Dichomitus squalens]|uniref:Uncharacterized protein n=1 Tax=Dichomitus squalens TaxID=114155 RepID=A0A4Q9PW09_9APHY|nr:hypothetical protein BD311DRAFT_786117 [Dichomitus squalens]TBU40467.1 hypothetical protein BD309DRAFT_967457 [Dichomitus squalens]TBU58705.1 hypothetical protein BD310DRAFT_447234 [Dichomitus squalens]